jgi:hypothetical protein
MAACYRRVSILTRVDICANLAASNSTTSRGTTDMSIQVQILADLVNQERAQSLSPVQERRRSAARLLAQTRCCTVPSWSSRLLAALEGPATGCCVAA